MHDCAMDRQQRQDAILLAAIALAVTAIAVTVFLLAAHGLFSHSGPCPAYGCN